MFNKLCDPLDCTIYNNKNNENNKKKKYLAVYVYRGEENALILKFPSILLLWTKHSPEKQIFNLMRFN